MAGVGELEQLGVRQRLGVLRVRSGRGCRGRACPTPRARASSRRPSSRAGCREHLRRRAAVQAQDRALGALVEVVEHAVEPRLGHRPRGGVGLLRGAAQRAPAGRAHRQLAEQRRAPDARDPVPAVAGQERHRVDHHQALDRARGGAGRRRGRRRPSRARRGSRARPRRSSRKRSRKRRTRRSCSAGCRACPSARSRAGRARGRRVRSRKRSQSSELVGTPCRYSGRSGAPRRRAAARCARRPAARRARRCVRSPRAPGEDIGAIVAALASDTVRMCHRPPRAEPPPSVESAPRPSPGSHRRARGCAGCATACARSTASR